MIFNRINKKREESAFQSQEKIRNSLRKYPKDKLALLVLETNDNVALNLYFSGHKNSAQERLKKIGAI